MGILLACSSLTHRIEPWYAQHLDESLSLCWVKKADPKEKWLNESKVWKKNQNSVRGAGVVREGTGGTFQGGRQTHSGGRVGVTRSTHLSLLDGQDLCLCVNFNLKNPVENITTEWRCVSGTKRQNADRASARLQGSSHCVLILGNWNFPRNKTPGTDSFTGECYQTKKPTQQVAFTKRLRATTFYGSSALLTSLEDGRREAGGLPGRVSWASGVGRSVAPETRPPTSHIHQEVWESPSGNFPSPFRWARLLGHLSP